MLDQVTIRSNALGMALVMVIVAILDQFGSDPSNPLSLLIFFLVMVPILMVFGAVFDTLASRYVDKG